MMKIILALALVSMNGALAAPKGIHEGKNFLLLLKMTLKNHF